MDKRICNLLLNIVKDLEHTRYKISGYSYVRTIRNILVGKEEAYIAPHFKDKPYYGLLDRLTLEETEQMMDEMVRNRELSVIHTEHGKLYCTNEYHEDVCKR